LQGGEQNSSKNPNFNTFITYLLQYLAAQFENLPLQKKQQSKIGGKSQMRVKDYNKDDEITMMVVVLMVVVS